jgi:fimbrial chaperone protein
MTFHRIVFSILYSLLFLFSCTLHAQGFSALVSPPRVEATAKVGTTYRSVIEITNVSDATSHFNLYTADWTLDPNGSAIFDNKLASNSCRPWVGIEAKEITVAARAKRRYRFEVAIPKDALARECRFAIMLEGDPETVKGKVAVPVSGRIGVIVYLSVGELASNLKIEMATTKSIEGRKLPAFKVTNTGNAHTRLEGYAELVDAKNKKWTVVPESLPILPGETRLIALIPQVEENKPSPTPSYPVKISGKLDAGKQRVPVDFVIGP